MGMLNFEFLNLKNATIKGLSTAFYNDEKKSHYNNFRTSVPKGFKLYNEKVSVTLRVWNPQF